jgi:hypothetical protein
MPLAQQVGLFVPAIGMHSYTDIVILIVSHPIVRWWVAVSRAADVDSAVVPRTATAAALELIVQPLSMPAERYMTELDAYLTQWRNSTQMPDELRPPPTPKPFEFAVDVPKCDAVTNVQQDAVAPSAAKSKPRTARRSKRKKRHKPSSEA